MSFSLTSASSSIARMVSEDAGLSIKVLQLANSPLFGQGYFITNPSDAVMCRARPAATG